MIYLFKNNLIGYRMKLMTSQYKTPGRPPPLPLTMWILLPSILGELASCYRLIEALLGSCGVLGHRTSFSISPPELTPLPSARACVCEIWGRMMSSPVRRTEDP